jgi:putative transposase
MVDATFIKSREGDRVVSRAVLIISSIREDGGREILGLKIGDTESFATWEESFRWLKSRGLKGVLFIVSDQHAGLVEAARKHFQGATWQRCQVHLMRNILGSCSTRHRKEIAEKAKLVLQAPDMPEAKRRLNEFIERFEKLAPKAVACLEKAFEDAMAVMILPDKYRKRLRTTNMQERLNGEVKRRVNVIRIFPNDDSALRLIGALLAETNEQWQTRRYLDMDEFNEWLSEQEQAKANVVEINKMAN